MTKKFDSATRKVISMELVEAAKVIAEKYGMTAEAAGGSYDFATYTTKIQFAIPAAVKEKEEATGTLYATAYGLPENVIGMTFKSNTKIFKVMAINPNRPKNPIDLEDQDGQRFKCSIEHLKRSLQLPST